MPESGNQGNGSAGQEPGAGTQGQGQEPAQQTGQGQEPGAGHDGTQGGTTPPDFAAMPESELRTYAATLHRQASEARQEAAAHRTKATALQGQVTEAERAAMTEQQRVQSDLQQAQQTLQERETAIQELNSRVEDMTRGHAVREALAGIGALNPATAFKVGTWEDVKLKDDGTVDAESFKAAAAALRTSDPYLFRRNADAGAGAGRGASPEGGASGINDLFRPARRA